MLGTTLGLVWTPCAGPVLGSILTLVATSKDTAWASLLLVVYAIGAALPMLAIAYGGQAVTTRVRSIARISPRLQQGFGVVVIAFAVAVLLSIRHADRGVADRILPERPDRPLIPTAMETAMTTTIACRIRLGHRALPDRRRHPRRQRRGRARPTAPFTVAAGAGHRARISPASATGSIRRRSTSRDLRGKVVLVDFWTYGCVNCVNTLPHVTELYAKYKDRGLVVVGIHTPEFPFERSAVQRPGRAETARHHLSGRRRTMIRRPGTPIATSIGRRNTSSTRTERSCSSMTAKASTSEIDRTIARLLERQ